MTEYTSNDIARVVQPYTKRCYFLPICILLLDVSLFVGCACLSATSSHHLVRMSASLLCGLSIGMLFIVGHDACHQSLTPSRAVNRVIGTLAFLPSLHAFSLWELGHNKIHHRFTNLAPVDYSFPPLSLSEYDALPAWQRFVERIYRTVPGHGLFYAVRIWWQKMFWPRPDVIAPARTIYYLESALVSIFLAAWIAAAVAASAHSGHGVLSGMIYCVAIPFTLWNWIMGFVIWQHHQHPEVAWFKTKEEWIYLENQLEGTTHITFPSPINLILHNIMEHTAHHVCSVIPMYQLRKAQAALESNYGDKICIVKWTLRDYLKTVRACKLYDYENHYWLDFSGNRTSACTAPAKSGRSSPSRAAP